jgi:hypothetical protein
MIIPDRKKTVSVILSKLSPEGAERLAQVKPEEEMDSHDDMLKSICEDMLMAFRHDSAHDLMMAMKAFMMKIRAADEIQDEREMR